MLVAMPGGTDPYTDQLCQHVFAPRAKNLCYAQLIAGIVVMVTACSLWQPRFTVRWQMAQLAWVHPLR